ncbi:hypothetical protein BDY21DRAFT_184483 [Lineolata rhizophorae]|uniref:Uncharacterized protein n=1 Tax=Lineolata rhizophorae TaxID=578093 RepID=A0A6A6P8J2_9PEZI|nr:hypothetical protein BDY21DRAFT_184483 [Lineolata rhizophorae]
MRRRSSPPAIPSCCSAAALNQSPSRSRSHHQESLLAPSPSNAVGTVPRRHFAQRLPRRARQRGGPPQKPERAANRRVARPVLARAPKPSSGTTCSFQHLGKRVLGQNSFSFFSLQGAATGRSGHTVDFFLTAHDSTRSPWHPKIHSAVLRLLKSRFPSPIYIAIQRRPFGQYAILKHQGVCLVHPLWNFGRLTGMA